MKIAVSYKVRGPLLEGKGPALIDKAVLEAVDVVSAEGLRRLHTWEHAHFKHPTGFYESRTVRTMRSNGYDLHDSNVIYGPWLEGVSRRNQATRFKGYWTFRTIGQQLSNEWGTIAAPVFDRLTGELNGN